MSKGKFILLRQWDSLFYFMPLEKPQESFQLTMNQKSHLAE